MNKYDECVKPRLADIAQWRRNGKTKAEVADLLGVSLTSLKAWQKDKSDLLTALNETKETADNKVKQSLFDKCFPHDIEETETIYEYQIDSVTGDRIAIPVMKKVKTRHIEASDKAIALYLSINTDLNTVDEETNKVLVIPKRQLLEEVTYEEHMDTTT